MEPRTSFKPVEPNLPLAPVTIEVSQGTISAFPNSGAVRVQAGQQVSWQCPKSFVLTLRQIGGSAPHPWEVPKPMQNSAGTWSVSSTPPSFGPLEVPPYYNYTITIGELTLDPIVIVDK
jgi:hypothetical protein